MIKRKKLKICLKKLLIPTKNTFIVFPFTCQSKYVCHYLCLISLMSSARSLDIVNVFVRLFFSFFYEICILNNRLKVVFKCVFFSFCHEICILNNRSKVVFECVFFIYRKYCNISFFLAVFHMSVKEDFLIWQYFEILKGHKVNHCF